VGFKIFVNPCINVCWIGSFAIIMLEETSKNPFYKYHCRLVILMQPFIKQHVWPLLIGLLTMFFLINISIGSVWIPFGNIFSILVGFTQDNLVWKNILIDFRLTKSITCILAGGALSLGGLMMQTLFRNPLAGPDVLGLSAGASLAVAVLIMVDSVGGGFLQGSLSIILAATFGAGFIFLLIMVVARSLKDNTSLLLIGLMIGAGTSSLVSVLQFSSRAEDQHYFLVWTFGSMGGLNWQEISILSLVFLSGLILCLSQSKSLNSWLLGEYYAQSLGVNLKRTRLIIILSTSLLAGSVTAFCGPIAFVGLAVPHLARLLINTTNHKVLIPGVAISGAIFMLFCDSLAQLPGSAYVLPINAITALLGAPVVIWVIVRSKKLRV
jgi:iron complex transport system permease protein